jgi:phosphatidylglycerophosphate synthase
VLLGLAPLTRIARAAERAGYDRVVVVRGGPGTESQLAGTGAVALDAAEPIADTGRPWRVVLLAANVIPQVEWLRCLRTMPLPPTHLALDETAAGAMDTADPWGVVTRAAGANGGAGLAAAFGPGVKPIDGPRDTAGRFALERPGDADQAERWMLRSLVKDSEGIMSRHFERRVSLWLTRRLAATRVTPNAVTIVSLAIGLGSAPFFLSAAAPWQVAGALVLLTHSILDGCDGELARLKFLQSRLGAVLDFWGDNLVHVFVFTCMALGWHRASGSALPLAAGGAAVVGTLVAAALLHRWQAGPVAPGSRTSAAGWLVDRFAHRDFIYLVLALAAWGRAWWFLVPAACGIPLFLLALGWMGGLRRAGRPG